MFIKPFIQISKTDALTAGGKGASLGEMTSAGIPVPAGFVILAEAFEKFLEETDLNVEIEAILKKVDHQKIHTVENASEKIQALILEAKMPAGIEQEIEKEFQKLGTKFVAVRSSATAEDGAEAAWAGQLESFLNTTEKTLLANVQKCWASLFTPRAIFYRFEKGLHQQKISVAVVVQHMIESEVSGISFSVHPVTQDFNQLIIEAGLGLGEAIVSGSITPDAYVVSKKPLKIIDINVSEQVRGLFRKKDGGNVWQDIPAQEGAKQKLTEKQILELSDLIMKIERHYDFPCDIEWACEKKKFYITQSRPITTLEKKEKKAQEKYVKIFNRPLYVMACQNFDLGERVEMKKISPIEYYMDPVFHNMPKKGTNVYYNFSDLSRDPRVIAQYFNKNRGQLLKRKEIFYEDCDLLRVAIKNPKYKDYQKLFKLTAKMWPFVAISNMLGDERENVRGVDGDLVNLYREMRKYSDGLTHNSHLKMAVILEDVVPKKYRPYIKYLKYEEVTNDDYPTIKELKNRQQGYVFHKGELYAGVKLEEYAKDNGYDFIGFESDGGVSEKLISGQTAYGGKLKGKVKIVLEIEDIGKVKKGDVLVTSMTTPDFLQAMEKAAAFVTDEGGVTCHASIIAREFKKPCIIGTKVATQVLHDGDLVEVDADQGVVKILKSGRMDGKKR